MIINSIQLKNFCQFTKENFSFSEMTFIKGSNGKGKTNMSVNAILFALYGYTNKTLAELPNKTNKSKSCMVIVELEYNGDMYIIERHYPTFIKITVNNEIKEFKTNDEAQRWLNSIFKDVNTFKQFRMIDNSIGINILDKGPQELKKILFSVSDEIFNKAKENLNTIKQEREVYNKDKAVVFKHAPSEKRLKILQDNIGKIRNLLNKVESEDRKYYNELSQYVQKKGQAEGQLKTAKWQYEQTQKSTHCFACKQQILEDTKTKMITEKIKEINGFEIIIKESQDIIQEINEIKLQNQEPINNYRKQIEKINILITKLNGRLQQKNYIYTQKDIEIVKRALLELDKLSSKYLTQSIKILEPIINSVLEKISFHVEFELNDKGKFSISLIKDGIKYDYKELSSGQRLLVQIGFKLALLMERNETGLIIADEGLSNLDRENLQHVLKLFNSLPFQLIMVLHGFDDIPENMTIIDLNKEN